MVRVVVKSNRGTRLMAAAAIVLGALAVGLSAAAIVVLLTQPRPEPRPGSMLLPPVQVTSPGELVDELHRLGLDCQDYAELDDPAAGAAWGSCFLVGVPLLVAVYTEPVDAAGALAQARAQLPPGSPVDLVVGGNWVVYCADAEQAELVVLALGGKYLSRTD